MSEQESKDLKEMQEKRDEIRCIAFNAMHDALRMTEAELRPTGFKTTESIAMPRSRSMPSSLHT
jgi:hypothetical protein